MAKENAAFEKKESVKMTSFAMSIEENDPSTGEINHAYENGNGNGTDAAKDLEEEVSINNLYHEPEVSFTKTSFKRKVSSRNMSSTKVSTVDNQQMTSIGKNGNETGRDSEPHVATKTRTKVESTEAKRYESSQKLFYVQISFFAMCGCLCRIGSDRIFGSLAVIEDPGEIINQSFFSNIFGCFVLGALNGSPMGKTRLAALYKGLTTGFCGSFTTWSKWNQQLSLTLVGETFTESQSQVMSIASWFIGFYCYLGSYTVGLDFGKDIGARIGKHVSKNGPKHCDMIVSVLLLLAFVGFALGVAFDITQSGKVIWLSVIFAPFGACLRAWLAQFKIEKIKMPLGTFLANLIGALILAALHVIDCRVAEPECQGWSLCWPSIVLSAIGTGFCACLTTISTFMSEIYKLRPDHPKFAYFYAIITVVVCQILCGIINGVNHSQPYYSASSCSNYILIPGNGSTTNL